MRSIGFRFGALQWHHRALKRKADESLIGHAFAFGVFANGVEQSFRKTEIDALLLGPNFELHRLEIAGMQIVREVLFEKGFRLFIGFEVWNFLFHISRFPSCAYSAR